MTYSVFISYSTRDLPTANALASWINHAGAAAFIAEYAVEPGQPLATDIVSAIRNCDLFLLLWSSNARGSEWVPQEIGIAKGTGKPIMPVVLHPGLELPGFIRDLKYVPLDKDPQSAVNWLHSHVVQQIDAKNRNAWVALGVVGAIVLALAASNKS